MDILQTLALGILQGITEFLPISSAAHLILVPVLVGWPDQGLGFDLSVHLGTLAAVLLYFRRDVARLTCDGVSAVVQRRAVGQSRLAWAVIIGTIPTGLAGLMLMDVVETTLRSAQVIFVTTIVFGLLLGLADRVGARHRSIESITWRDALLIGCAQAIALVPGTSRSGVTITAGLFLGLDREAASRFSFLLAIPITALAASVTLLRLAESDAPVEWGSFVWGGVISFVTALAAIHYFLKWLNRYGMWPYVVYRLLMGGVIYLVLL